MKRLLLTSLLVIALPAVAGNVDERGDADLRGEVEISNTAGSIEVTVWDKAEVAVTGSLDGSSRLKFETDPVKRHTLVKVEDERGRGGDGADLSIRVPELSRLTISTVSAEIKVTGVKGRQRLQSVSGELESEVWAEDVEVRTVSGDVEVRGKDGGGLVTMTTVSGDARAKLKGGEIVVASVSGDLDLKLGEIRRARLRTTSGDMVLGLSLADNAHVDIETINGDLEISLAGKLDAEFDIETFNGDINNCFGPEPQRRSEYAPGTELRFVEGGGNNDMRIKTMNGDVHLCTD